MTSCSLTRIGGLLRVRVTGESHRSSYRSFAVSPRISLLSQTVRLFTAPSLPIIRHTKINSQVNPYDPQWEPYLEQRQGLKMAASLQGRRTLLYLWQRQEGRCPHCGEAITTITGWHNHHKVWRSHGGSDTTDNRVLLHPTCHSQVHHARGSTCGPHPVTRVFRRES